MEPYYCVRKATLDDVETMVQMQLAMAHETEKITLDRNTVERGIRYPLEHPNVADYYIAECDDKSHVEGEVQGQVESGKEEEAKQRKKKVVAMLMTTFEWSEWRAGSILWIQSVFVVPEHRRRGIFNIMYSYLKSVVEASDLFRGIRLYVEETNDQAIATYEKVGMKQEHYRLMKWMKGKF